MKVKDGFIIKQIVSQYVVMATGDVSLSFDGMLLLLSMVNALLETVPFYRLQCDMTDRSVVVAYEAE